VYVTNLTLVNYRCLCGKCIADLCTKLAMVESASDEVATCGA
jgi:hypothetical protein